MDYAEFLGFSKSADGANRSRSLVAPDDHGHEVDRTVGCCEVAKIVVVVVAHALIGFSPMRSSAALRSSSTPSRVVTMTLVSADAARP